MSGPASFRLSRETRDLLKQHQDFFSSVLDLYDGKGDNPQKTPLKFKPADGEARTEAEVKSNGDVEVTFIIPLDDNEKAGDGRVYLKDKFVFDPTHKVLKGYKRSFEHNGKGDAASWKGWLGKYEAVLKNGPGLGSPVVQRFGLSVARTFGQAMVDEQEKPLEKFAEAFKQERRYLDSLNGLITSHAQRFGLDGLKLRRDKESHYQVIRNGEQLDLILKWVADDDAKPENGRVWLKDRFTFKDGKFTNFSRDWLSDPKAEGAEKHGAMVESLKRQPNPDLAETAAFAENLKPYLVSEKSPNPQDLTPLLAASVKVPAAESAFKLKDPAGLDASQSQVLKLAELFAKEDVAKRADHAEGLVHFESKVDVPTETGQVESLFQKLSEARQKSPGGNLRTLLENLSLSEGEHAHRQRLLKSSSFRELLSLAQERDAELLHQGLFHLAKHRLFGERGYPGTATAIAGLLKDDAALGAKASKLLDLANGKGSFGSKVEMTLGHFQHEMTKPSMLVGMMAAPFAGAAFEAGALRGVKYLYDAQKIQSIGRAAKIGSSVWGSFGESLAFTAMHRGFERLSHGSERAWAGAGQEVASSMLMFIGMKATHAGTGWATSRAAEGKLNFKVGGREIRFGGREGTAAHGPNLFQATPTGRLLMGNPWVPEAGIGAPTLTKLGQATAGTANHLGGIFAMQASTALSQKVGLMPDNGQGFAANFFDSTVMYGQAMIGFSLANRATMGRLQPALGEVKMRIEGFDPKATYTPLAPERADKGGGRFQFGPWLQNIRASRAAAKPQAEPKAEGWGARVRESLSSAREWLSKLSPAKVRELEAKLTEVETRRAAAQAEADSKGRQITELETVATQLTGERDSARSEATGHKTEAETKGTRIGELERELGEQQAEVATKTQEIAAKNQEAEAAKGEAQREKEAREAAEGKLHAIEENAEAADLGLPFSDSASEAQALRQKIQILTVEKSDAEVRASAAGQEATELRGQIETANQELKRREGIDAALTQAESRVGELQAAKTELETSIGDLRRDLASKKNETDAASKLLGQMGEKISTLEQSLNMKEGLLTEGAAEINRLRGEVETTAREAQMLADKLKESDAQLGLAKNQLEAQESQVKALENTRDALEREKAQVQGQLNEKSGEAAGLTEKLAETDAALTRVNRELAGAKRALETADTVKRGKEAENDRLRLQIQEAQVKHNQEATELSGKIRALEGQVQLRLNELEQANVTAGELSRNLQEQTSRAEGAEARETALRTENSELQAQHEQTKKDLANAQRLLNIAESNIRGKEAQLEREKNGNEALKRNLNALRTRKNQVDQELIEAKAEKTRLETRLKESERQLAEERAKPPEYDATAQFELAEALEAFEGQKTNLEQRIRDLETTQRELEGKTQKLEQANKESERQVRSLETDLELAQGSAKSQKQDLEDLQARSKKEAEELRATLESWRVRATDAEAGKGRAESRVTSLEGDLGRVKTRVETVERELKEQGETLKAEREKAKKLGGEVGELVAANEALQGQIQTKEAEMATAATEAKDEIGRLSQERDAQAGHLREKEEQVTRLKAEVARKHESLTAAEKDTRNAKDEARRESNRLGDEKRVVERERDAKARELAAAENKVTELRREVSDLEESIGRVRREAEAEQEKLNSEKRELSGDLDSKTQELTEARRQLAESEARSEELQAQLDEANGALKAEKTALANLRLEVEETEARNASIADRLRDEARVAGQARETAEGKVREANARLSQIETQLTQAKSAAEQAEQKAKTDLGRAEQRATTAETNLAERTRELEAQRTAAKTEAEKLRGEAVKAATNESVAQAKVEELEQKSALDTQRIQTLETELAAAQAQVEALQAPASQHQVAAAKVAQLNGELAAEKQRLTAAEARATAAEQKVKAAEATAAAEKARAEAEALRAREADEKLTQRNLRIVALEADVSLAQSEGAEQARAATAYETQTKARIAELETQARDFEGQAQAAEARAQEAETKATEADRAARELDQQLIQMAHSLSAAKDAEAAANRQVESLKEEKVGLETKAGQLEATISRLEADALAKIAERKKLDAQAGTDKAKITELEGKIRELEAKIAEVWSQSQTTGQESIAQKTSLEEQKATITELEEQLEIVREDLRVAQDAQNTVRLLEESEGKLQVEIRKLTGERNEALRRIGELENELNASSGGIDPEISLAAYNLRSAGAGEGFFQQADPRQELVVIQVKDSVLLRRADGMPAGEAKIIAGGEQGDMVLEFLDGSNASTRTTKGGRPYQEDATYLGRFTLADGREVKILAGSDGAGGHKSGDLASSAFLQGLHAQVVDAAREGRIPSAGELFEQGERALGKQKEQLGLEDNGDGKKGDPTGTAAVVVIVGNEATIATKGDANFLWARPDAKGEFEVLGLSETDAIFDSPANLAARKYNVIVRGVGIEQEGASGPRLYGIRNIRQGDRFLLGSDGFWGVMVGPDLVEATSSHLRQLQRPWPEASQETFDVVRWGLKASNGQADRAAAWHDLALQQMKNPTTEKTFFGERRQIDFRDRPDNIFTIDMEQGLARPNAESIIPEGYGDLWPVLSSSETKRRSVSAGEAPRPNSPSPPPPPLPPRRSRAAIQEEFSGKYVQALSEVYGTVLEGGALRLSRSGNDAAKQFIELYARYPELEGQINPQLLNAADWSTQIKMFDGAAKFLEDVKSADPAKANAAKEILKSIRELRKVFPKAGPEDVAHIQSTYRDGLHRLFGPESEPAARLFADLHKAVPEVADLFNPATLSSPTLFNLNYFYREINQKIAASEQPYQPPSPAEVSAVHAKYQAALERIFGAGEGAARAASWFAGLYKVLPSASKDYTPETITSKKVLQQLIVQFNRDRVRITDSAPGSGEGPIGYAADIKQLMTGDQGQALRAARGWAKAESWVTGIRFWELEPGNEQTPARDYVGGRRQGNIILEEGSVSGRHFVIRHEKKWTIQEIEAQNGIFINGKELKSGRAHDLKNGDKLRFGHVELQWTVDGQNHGHLIDLKPQATPEPPAPPRPQAGAAPAPKPAAAAPATSAPPASVTPSGRGYLFNVSHGSPYILGHEQIPDYGISPEHLQIERVEGRWYVQDRGSTFGTRLNGQEIAAAVNPRSQTRPAGKKFELNPNDEIKLGNLVFSWNGAQLVQTGGAVVPPSTRYYRSTPGYSNQPLQPGQKPLPLVNGDKHQIGAIEWDASRGQFRLRNGVANTQLWVQTQGKNHPLNDSCILHNGMIFGIGLNEGSAQYFLFRDNILTAVDLKGANHSHKPAADFQAPLHLQYSLTDPRGARLGRQHFRDHPSLSGEHVDFRQNGPLWEVRDVGSLNGTYLNGEKISTGNPGNGDPRVEGPWRPVKSGDIVTVGQLNMRFHAEGNAFSLDEVLPSSSEPPRSGPISTEGFPSSYRPSPTSGFREARADLTQLQRGVVPMELGDSRFVLITRRGGDPGLYYRNPEQPMNGEYALNLGRESILKGGLFDKDLFNLERLEGDRYRLTNIGAKSGLLITNDRGARRKVEVGGTDQVVVGDTVVLEDGKTRINFLN